MCSSDLWRGSVVFSVPVFDSGLRKGYKMDRVAQLDAIKFQRASVERQVTSEVRTAREAVASTERASVQARLAAEQATLLALGFLPLVAGLMVSTWPTFSGKALGRQALRHWFPASAAILAALGLGLALAPWATAIVAAVAYIWTFPVSKWRHDTLRSRSALNESFKSDRTRPIR